MVLRYGDAECQAGAVEAIATFAKKRAYHLEIIESGCINALKRLVSYGNVCIRFCASQAHTHLHTLKGKL